MGYFRISAIIELSDISYHRMASSENVASHWHAGKRCSVDIHSVGPVVFEVDVGGTIPQSLLWVAVAQLCKVRQRHVEIRGGWITITQVACSNPGYR